MLKEGEVGVMHFEDGGSPQATALEYRGHWKMKKARKCIFLLEPTEGSSPADTLILAQ